MKEVNVKVLIPDDVDLKKVIDLSLMVRYQKENDKWQFVTMPFTLTDSAEIKGEWKMPIQDDGMSDPIYYQVRCSRCGFDIDPQTWYEELHQFNADNFCPNCGADMREPIREKGTE